MVANIQVRACRRLGVGPDLLREDILGQLREAWEGKPPRGHGAIGMDGDILGSPAGAFGYALALDHFAWRDDRAWETAAAVVRREVDRELFDPGYRARPGYRDESMF
jgi:hypothetical protein